MVFVDQYLKTGNLLNAIGIHEATSLAKAISPPSLVKAVVTVSASEHIPPISQLWLLGQFLRIVELSGRKREFLRHPNYVQAIAQLLRKSTSIHGFIPMRWSSIGIGKDDDEEEDDTVDSPDPTPAVQRKPTSQSGSLSQARCVICLDSPTDLVATPCGTFLRFRDFVC